MNIKRSIELMGHFQTFRHLLFLFVLSIVSTSVSAASFDCAKASTKVEKFICSDDDLSQLDNELAKLYASVKRQSSDIVNQQKNWLRQNRDACGTVDCLKLAYKNQIAHLKKCNQCLISEQAMLGKWQRVKNGFFEEMSFSINNGEHDFNSWLHHRPEMTGKWKIENCTLIISDGQGEARSFEFKLKKIRKNILYIFDEDNNEGATYKKSQ